MRKTTRKTTRMHGSDHVAETRLARMAAYSPRSPCLRFDKVDQKPQSTRQRLENHSYGRPNLKLVAVHDVQHDPLQTGRELPPLTKAVVKRLPVGAKGYNHLHGSLNLRLVAGAGHWLDPEGSQERRPGIRAAVKRLPEFPKNESGALGNVAGCDSEDEERERETDIVVISSDDETL